MNGFLTILSVALSFGAYVFIFEPNKTIAIIASGISLCVCIALLLLEKLIKNKGNQILDRLFFHLTKADTYVVSERHLIYEMVRSTDDFDEYKFTKKYTFIAKVDDFHELSDGYSWSSDDTSARLHEYVQGQTVIPCETKEPYSGLKIVFNNSYSKGKEVQTGVIISNLIDKNKRAKPFLRHMIRKKTRLLVLTVKLPARPNIAEFTIQDKNGKEVVHEMVNYDPEQKSITKRILYPRKGFIYSLIWE